MLIFKSSQYISSSKFNNELFISNQNSIQRKIANQQKKVGRYQKYIEIYTGGVYWILETNK